MIHCLYSIFDLSLQFLFFVQFPSVCWAILPMCHQEYKAEGGESMDPVIFHLRVVLDLFPSRFIASRLCPSDWRQTSDRLLFDSKYNSMKSFIKVNFSTFLFSIFFWWNNKILSTLEEYYYSYSPDIHRSSFNIILSWTGVLVL